MQRAHRKDDPNPDGHPDRRPDTHSATLLTKFGETIRQRRLSAGLSQEAFADIVLLHRTYIGAIERGERNISLLCVVKLAAALKVSVSRLTEGL